MEHGSDSFNKGLIESFNNPIFLWGIVHGESTLGTMTSEVIAEFFAEVLPPAIGAQALDLHVVLCVQPWSVPRLVIGEGNVLFIFIYFYFYFLY